MARGCDGVASRRHVLDGVGRPRRRPTGHTGSLGAADSGQIDRYRQCPHTSASATPANTVSVRISATARAQLLLDRVEVVGVGLERRRVVDDLGRRGARTRCAAAALGARERREHARLEPRLLVVGDAASDQTRPVL